MHGWFPIQSWIGSFSCTPPVGIPDGVGKPTEEKCALQKTRRIVSLAKVKSMGQTRKCMRYIKWQLAFCLVMEVRVRVLICFSLEKPTPTKPKKVSLSLLGAELKKMDRN